MGAAVLVASAAARDGAAPWPTMTPCSESSAVTVLTPTGTGTRTPVCLLSTAITSRMSAGRPAGSCASSRRSRAATSAGTSGRTSSMGTIPRLVMILKV